MRTLLLTLATGAALSFGAVAAQAMPANAIYGSDAAPKVTLVSGGCGFGYHRGPYGGCRPNGGFFRPAFRRHCFMRFTPFGPRRFCD